MRHFRLPSGSLLLGFGVSVLSCCSTHSLSASQQQKIQPARTSGSKQIASLPGKQQAAPKSQEETKKLQYGDISIAYFTSMEGLLEGKEIHFKGKKTEIDVPDKASKSVLHVHADDIIGTPTPKGNLGLIKLTGNVRYRLVQQLPEGERILEGSSARAVVQRLERHIEFTGGSHVKLTDAARFRGPATLDTGTLNVFMEAKTYRYTLEGPPGGNDIKFTPLQAPPPVKAGAKPGAPTPVGLVHIFGFRSGDLAFGQAIHLHGAGTTCDFASPDDKTAWHLQGQEFEGEFVPNTTDIQRATVMENVKFHTKQPSAHKKLTTTVDGTASQASYVRSKEGQEMVAHGPLDITLDDPEHFEKPAPFTVGPKAKLVVRKEGDTLHYSLVDPDATFQGNFQPKIAADEDTKPANVPVPK